MFSWPRTRRFLGNVLLIVIPFLLLNFIFALLAETATRKALLREAIWSVQLWLEVCLALLPMIASMALALLLAGRFVQTVYHLDSLGQAINFIVASRCDLRSFKPWVRIRNGAVDEGGSDILEKVGGPGHLVIYHDNAAVLERGGCFTWVPGAVIPENEESRYPSEKSAGFPRLNPFEKLYAIVDLRPKRAVHRVGAMTREGIVVNWDVDLRYQIGSGSETATEGQPYPLSPARALRAATSQLVHHQDRAAAVDWEDRLSRLETERYLRPILASRGLDQLIGLTKEKEEAAREAIRSELEEKLRAVAPELGAKILQVKLDNLKVRGEITKEWIDTWRARCQERAAMELAGTEGQYVSDYEIAKAEAQIQMVEDITRELQERPAVKGISSEALSHMVLMRLFSVLDRTDFAPNSRVFFPTQTMDALDAIRDALDSDQTAGRRRRTA